MSTFSTFFFFNDTATTEIYTLSLHDALPISFPSWRSLQTMLAPSTRGNVKPVAEALALGVLPLQCGHGRNVGTHGDRKSTRLNSSHVRISYAVFCLKKKKELMHIFLVANDWC